MANERTANELEHARWVRDMFGNIATRYDFINRVLAINIDRSWRKKVARILAPILQMSNAVVLDIACGTGDLSLELHKGAKAKIIGTDFCRPMLAIAQTKTAKQNLQIPYIEGDGLALPFANNTFNAVTVSFGLRNFSNWDDGLIEMQRVLKPGGQLAVLEFGSPTIPVFKQTYNFYFDNVLPKLGGMLSGNQAGYEHLNKSVRKFPNQKEFVALLQKIGFSHADYKNVTGGIAAIYLGTKI